VKSTSVSIIRRQSHNEIINVFRCRGDFKDTEEAVSLLAPLARYIAGHWAMENPKMAANRFSAKKSNVHEKLLDLFYLLRLISRATH